MVERHGIYRGTECRANGTVAPPGADNEQGLSAPIPIKYQTKRLVDLRSRFGQGPIIGNRSSGEYWPKLRAVKVGMIGPQGDDAQGLINAVGYTGFDIAGVSKTFNERERHKHKDLMGCRGSSRWITRWRAPEELMHD